MKIPNGENAIVDIRKLRDYALNPKHRVGKHKAKLFAKLLDMRLDDAAAFTRIMARHWRLKQALINGHHTFKSAADDAYLEWSLLLDDDPQRAQLSHTLIQLLDATCRSSSSIEGVNKLLKQFLHNHQAFRSSETLQLYLNLFVLWHNMRPFERGKRQGRSPYQIAGIDPGADDWLSCLGYSAA